LANDDLTFATQCSALCEPCVSALMCQFHLRSLQRFY
jgi:hypothetical protein